MLSYAIICQSRADQCKATFSATSTAIPASNKVTAIATRDKGMSEESTT